MNRTIKVRMKLILLITFWPCVFLGQFISIFGFNISIIYIMLLLFYCFGYFIKKKFKLYINSYLIIIGLIIFYASLSIFREHIDKQTFIITFLPLVTGYIILLFISTFNIKDLNVFLHFLELFIIFLIGGSFFEIIFGTYYITNIPQFIGVKNFLNLNYPLVCFVNINDLSQFLCFFGPIIILKSIEIKRFYRAYFYIASILFIIINCMANIALSLYLLNLFIIFYIIFLKQKKLKKIFVRSFYAIFFLLILFLLFNIDIIEKTINTYSIDNNLDAYSIRMEIYLKLIEVGIQNFIVGGGIGSVYKMVNIGAHNFFLWLFVDLGIVSVTCFTIMLVTSMKKFWKNRNNIYCGFHIFSLLSLQVLLFPIYASISSVNEQRKSIWISLGLFMIINKVCQKEMGDRKIEKVVHYFKLWK